MKNRINNKIRKPANKDLNNFPTYHDCIPFQDIQNILEKHGMIALQEDYTEFAGFFCGDNDGCTLPLGSIDFSINRDSETVYNLIDNSMLRLTWYKTRPDRYEILVYVS